MLISPADAFICEIFDCGPRFLVVDSSFTALRDTPDSYTGFAEKCLIVNTDENGITFQTCAVGGGGRTYTGTAPIIIDNDLNVILWVPQETTDFNGTFDGNRSTFFIDWSNSVNRLFSLLDLDNNASFDERYINVSGDTMTGDLIVPNLRSTNDVNADGSVNAVIDVNSNQFCIAGDCIDEWADVNGAVASGSHTTDSTLDTNTTADASYRAKDLVWSGDYNYSLGTGNNIFINSVSPTADLPLLDLNYFEDGTEFSAFIGRAINISGAQSNSTKTFYPMVVDINGKFSTIPFIVRSRELGGNYAGGVDATTILDTAGGTGVVFFGMLEDNIGSGDAEVGYFWVEKNASGGDTGGLYVEEFDGSFPADYGLRVSGATKGFVNGIELTGTFVRAGIDVGDNNVIGVSRICNDTNCFDLYEDLNFNVMRCDADSVMLGSGKCQIAVTQEFSAFNIITINGSLDSGDVNSVQNIDDGNTYQVSETATTPGFTIDVNFLNISSFNLVRLHEHYTGSAGHNVDFQLYNFNNDVFDTLESISDQGDFVLTDIEILSPGQYIGSDGNVQLRINHSSPGNPTHDMNLDYAALLFSVTSGASTDHGGLSGLTDDDHSQYLLTDGSRELTGNWGVGDNNITFTDQAGLCFDSTCDQRLYSCAFNNICFEANASARFSTAGRVRMRLFTTNIILGADSVNPHFAINFDINGVDGEIFYDGDQANFQFDQNIYAGIDLNIERNLFLKGQIFYNLLGYSIPDLNTSAPADCAGDTNSVLNNLKQCINLSGMSNTGEQTTDSTLDTNTTAETSWLGKSHVYTADQNHDKINTEDINISSDRILVNDNNYSISGMATTSIGATFDGGNAALSADTIAYLQMPFDANIVSWTILPDQTGSITIDIWKVPYANYPPVDGNTMTGGNELKITNADANTSILTTGWTTQLNKGDTLAFNIDSATTIRVANISLEVKKQ